MKKNLQKIFIWINALDTGVLLERENVYFVVVVV
jgi:hypothetical protein